MSRDKKIIMIMRQHCFLRVPNTISTMSKLSPALKALISARFARPDTVAAPKHIRSVYQTIEREAASKDVGLPSWLAISVCQDIANALRSIWLTRRSYIDCRNDNNELTRIPQRASTISELVLQRHQAGCVHSRIDARSRTQMYQL